MTATRALRVPAVPDSLTDVHELLAELWSCGSVDPSDQFRFECAVIEVAGNILEHSVPTAGTGGVTVSVELALSPATIRAVFHDDGQPPDVQLGDRVMPDTSAENGRGLVLAQATSDVLDYHRDGAVNRWTVECTRSDAQPAFSPSPDPSST